MRNANPFCSETTNENGQFSKTKTGYQFVVIWPRRLGNVYGRFKLCLQSNKTSDCLYVSGF